jgi:IclR family mhp operon transcriptional activator
MPIRVDGHVLGCINLTWKNKVMTAAQAVKRHLDALGGAVKTIEQRAQMEGVGAATVTGVERPVRRRAERRRAKI